MAHLASASRLSGRLSAGWAPLVIVLGTAAAYHNSLHGPFVLDDLISIVDNESLRSLRDLPAVFFPRPEVFTAGRPLLNLSFAFNYAGGGTAVLGYHIVNWVIHTLAALTLFGLVRRTLLLPLLVAKFPGAAKPLATTAALLWAVHPLHTASVTYISQRAESLMGLFYLLTLYCLVRALERPQAKWEALCGVACLAGILVKEVMITAPLVALLFERTLVAGSFRAAWQHHRRLYLGLAATWAVLAGSIVYTQLHHRGVGYGFDYTWSQYLRIECDALVHYLRLSIWPHPLVFDYGNKIPVPSVARVWPSAALLGALVVVTGAAALKRSALGFLGCCFFIILGPTSSIIPAAGQPIAENRLYLPLAALAVGITAALWRLWGSKGLALLAGIAAVFAACTIARNHDYRSELTLWADTVEKRPLNARAHFYHGTALGREGKAAEGIAALERSLQLDPTYSYAHLNLAVIHIGQNRLTDALRHFEQALTLKKDDPLGHSNYAAALFQSGRHADALAHYRAALRLRTDYPPALAGLGITLATLGRVSEAVAVFEELVRLDPTNPTALDGLRQLRPRAPRR